MEYRIIYRYPMPEGSSPDEVAEDYVVKVEERFRGFGPVVSTSCSRPTEIEVTFSLSADDPISALAAADRAAPLGVLLRMPIAISVEPADD